MAESTTGETKASCFMRQRIATTCVTSENFSSRH
jgi:hypothetical protein